MFWAGEAPAVRGGSDGQSLQNTTRAFPPTAVPLTEQTLLPLLCVLTGTAGICGIRMAAGCCSAGGEGWLLLQLLDGSSSLSSLVAFPDLFPSAVPSTWLKKLRQLLFLGIFLLLKGPESLSLSEHEMEFA